MHRRGKVKKGSVYALQEPSTGQYLAIGDQGATLAPLAEATTAEPHRLAELLQLASRKLANTPHDLVRVDA